MMDDLLTELKERLQISWTDETTDRVLGKILARGMSFFNALCVKEFTFTENSPERELLMERCRYVWNNALDEFEVNYRKELKRLIMQVAVEKRKAGEASG